MKCLIPICDLRESPYRKTIKQLPFNVFEEFHQFALQKEGMRFGDLPTNILEKMPAPILYGSWENLKTASSELHGSQKYLSKAQEIMGSQLYYQKKSGKCM